MVLVMLATLSSRRRMPVRAGKVMNVPPPATALTAAARNEAKATRSVRTMEWEGSGGGGEGEGGQRSESEVRGQRSEVRGQRSEVRGQRSEVRGQRSEGR